MTIHTLSGAVRPQAFVDRMRDHWTGELSSVSTPELEEVWRRIGAAFWQRIDDYTNQKNKWTILRPETGTGKSQGTMVYCSMLPRANHPGVLIVTRMKADADAYAATINRLAGWEMAVGGTVFAILNAMGLSYSVLFGAAAWLGVSIAHIRSALRGADQYAKATIKNRIKTGAILIAVVATALTIAGGVAVLLMSIGTREAGATIFGSLVALAFLLYCWSYAENRP